jgi:hypothetical protein
MPRFALNPPATPNVAAAMPASGGRPTRANTPAASGGSTTYPASAAALDMTPMNTTTGESSARGVTITSSFRSAGKSPVRSATPIPSIATRTIASGGKSRKFRIAWVRIQRRPSASSSERTATVFDGSRGSTTDQPAHAPSALASSVAAPRRTKSVAGSGRRFPMRSTAERKPEGRTIGAQGSEGPARDAR